MTKSFSRKLYLASTSLRRRELLRTLDIRFEVCPPQFEEKPTSRSARDEVLYFAEQKAKSVMAHCPNALILASDTLVACGKNKIGKPRDAAEAVTILRELSGKKHTVYTALVLIDTQNGSLRREVEDTQVIFRTLSDQEIQDYVATGEPLGKAGAYAIQGKARVFVTGIEGEEEVVIGLPLKTVVKWLKKW